MNELAYAALGLLLIGLALSALGFAAIRRSRRREAQRRLREQAMDNMEQRIEDLEQHRDPSSDEER